MEHNYTTVHWFYWEKQRHLSCTVRSMNITLNEVHLRVDVSINLKGFFFRIYRRRFILSGKTQGCVCFDILFFPSFYCSSCLSWPLVSRFLFPSAFSLFTRKYKRYILNNSTHSHSGLISKKSSLQGSCLGQMCTGLIRHLCDVWLVRARFQ